MADDVRSPADITKRNQRSPDWYEPSVQQKWTAQSGRPCPPDVNSGQMYGHDKWTPPILDSEGAITTPGVLTPVDPYTALYYDDPNDPVPEEE